ncbi:MAG: SMC family ATPase, partial [Candidatus Korarchaeota archaeon]|nr:SMC family ATPase [Candidatus Korarchaeota archaeon]
MRLISLRAWNFKHLRGPSEGEPFEVEFGEGVLGVRGPNESGKSSLMQAVFFALTGFPLEGGREIGQYVGYGASKASVSLDFEVGERRFRVSRTIQRIQGSLDRGRSDARLVELRPDGSRLTVCRGIREVNARIRELLGGLGPEELRSTVFIIQKDLDRLKEKRPHERRELIDSLIGRESFDKAKESLAERRRELEGTPQRRGLIAEAKAELDRLRGDLERFRRASEELTEVVEKIEVLEGPADRPGSVEEARAERDAIRRDLKALRAYKNYLQERSELERRIHLREEGLRGLRVELDQLERDVQALEKARRDLQRVLEEIGILDGPPTDPRSIAHALAERDRLDKVVSSLRRLRDALQRKVQLTGRLAEIEEALAERGVELRGVQSELEELRAKLQSLRGEIRSLYERKHALKFRAETLTKAALGLMGLGAAALFLSFLTPGLPRTPAGALLGIGLAVFTYASKPREEFRRIEGMIPAMEAQERSISEEIRRTQRREAQISRELEGLRQERSSRQEELREVTDTMASLTRGLRSQGVDLPQDLADPESVDPLIMRWEEILEEKRAEAAKREENKKHLLEKESDLRGTIEGLRDAPERLKEKEREFGKVKEELESLTERLKGLTEPELPEHLRPYSDELLESYQERFTSASEEVARREKELENLRER